MTGHDFRFRGEVTLRDEHLLAVDRLMGQVRAVFPRDRARQDVIFPVVATGRTATDDGDDDELGGE